MENKTIQELRELGYAVAVFQPDELNGVDASVVEASMVEQGHEAIWYNK